MPVTRTVCFNNEKFSSLILVAAMIFTGRSSTGTPDRNAENTRDRNVQDVDSSRSSINPTDEQFVRDLLDDLREEKDKNVDISWGDIQDYGHNICSHLSDVPDEAEVRSFYWEIQDAIGSSSQYAFAIVVSGMKIECPSKYEAWVQD